MHRRPAGTQWKENTHPTKHTYKAAETQRGPTNQCGRSGCAKISTEHTHQRSMHSRFGARALFLTKGCAPGGLSCLGQAHVCFYFSAELQKLQVKVICQRVYERLWNMKSIWNLRIPGGPEVVAETNKPLEPKNLVKNMFYNGSILYPLTQKL